MLQLLQKLDLLREKLLAMASLVEKALDGSVRVLADRNELEARRVLDYEEQINALEIEVDQIATQLLALAQPVAKDLRFITAAIKINSDLERMGDGRSDCASDSGCNARGARGDCDHERLDDDERSTVRSGPKAIIVLVTSARPRLPCVPCPCWRVVSETSTCVRSGSLGSRLNVLRPAMMDGLGKRARLTKLMSRRLSAPGTSLAAKIPTSGSGSTDR